MGPRFPPGIPAALACCTSASRRAAHRAHRHRRWADAREIVAAARAGRGARSSSPASTGPNIRYRVVAKDERRSAAAAFPAQPSIRAMPASSIACRATRSRRSPPGCERRPRRAALPRRARCARRASATRTASCARKASSSSPPSPSAWASTSPTCASSPIWTCPRASKPITRRPAAPGATACPPMPG